MAFSLMFACEPKPQHPIGFPGFASFKLDGIRSATLHGRTWTRSSKEIPNDFTRALLNKCEGVDGEFIVGSPSAEDVFDVSSSAFRRFGGKPDFKLYAFDYIVDTDERSNVIERRLQKLASMVHLYNEMLKNILEEEDDRVILLEQRWVRNQEELDAFYEYALELGYEGVIYKRAGKLYKHGRSTSLSQEQLKMKPISDSEAVVLEIIEGTINNNAAFLNERGLQERSSHRENLVPSGMVGKLRCRDIYSGVEFLCSPGKMDHAMRRLVWDTQEVHIGKVFKYAYFPVGNYEKPRMNRFLAFRDLSDIDLTKAKYL